MKSHFKTTAVLLLVAFNLTSCVQSEKFVEISAIGSIENGIDDPEASQDVLCSDAKDFDACLELRDTCQPAFEDMVADNSEKKYKACIANPAEAEESSSQEPVAGGAGESSSQEPVAAGAGESSSQEPAPVPELADIKDCGQLDPKYLEIKSQGQPKVIICHHSCHGPHTIIIACPALKAHLNHHQGKDYLGACKPE